MADGGTDEGLAAAVGEVLARLGSLERKVDALAAGTGSSPPGVGRLLARLDEIEGLLDTATSFRERAPVVVDAAASVASRAWAAAEAKGVDVAARAELSLALAEAATDPEALGLLTELLGRKDLLRALIRGADELERALTEAGTDLDAFSRSGIGLAVRLAVLMGSDEFEELGTSGVFEPATVAVVTNAGRALVDTRAEPVERVGLFGLLRAMGDPDVQAALGFVLRVARRFGHRLPAR